MPSPRTFIAQSLPCLRCDYDLRSLHADDRCPECGTPAEQSFGHLSLLDAPDIKRLRTGALLAGLAAISVPAVYFSLLLAALFTEFVLRLRIFRLPETPLAMAAIAMMCSGPFMALAGWRSLTSPLPATPYGPAIPPTASNRALSVVGVLMCAFALCVVGAGWLIMLHIVDDWTVLRGGRSIAYATCFGLLWAARMHLGLPRLAELLARTSRRRSVNSCRVMRWFIWSALAIHGFGVLLFALDSSEARALGELSSRDMARICMAIAGAICVAITVWHSLLQSSLRIGLARARRLAASRNGPVLVSVDDPGSPSPEDLPASAATPTLPSP